MSAKNLDKLKLHLPHLKRVQSVDRTWNFSHRILARALTQIAQELLYWIALESQSFDSFMGKLSAYTFPEFIKEGLPEHPSVAMSGLRLCRKDEEFDVSTTWADSFALKLSAMCRHVAQEALKHRKWVPQDVMQSRSDACKYCDVDGTCV